MTRLRLLLLVAGAGTLLAGLPATAVGQQAGPESTTSGTAAEEPRALQLLTAASRAARARVYSGTQYVSSWRADMASSSVADVQHTSDGRSVISVRPTAGGVADSMVALTTDLDARLLQLLADHYALDVAPDVTCNGRLAHVVEASRSGVAGVGAVAGRFWIDAASALILRREVFDTAGRLVRSSAFATIEVGGAAAGPVEATAAATDGLTAADLDRLRADGWQVPATLPGELELFDARLRTHDGERVLHLSYSDGLSTLSLFAQRGRLGSTRMAGFTKQKLGRAAIWVRPASPERVVWGGGGRVFTLLSDAPPDAVHAVVTALPHEKLPKTGLLARLQRGLARLGSWLNPFG
jgi:sigma-E factor negative regulatory protein RseB